ncbi:MAG TPA: M48 family metalloprotease, partial [Blastocatellia bacterium]|nr:M48 family metalloprotease [Blastocatellia bacterium]
MSQLVRRSALVLGLLFGLVFAVGAGVLYYFDISILFAIAFAAAVVGVQYLTGPLIVDRVFSIRWTSPVEVSEAFAEWYRAQCGRARMPEPGFGIIRDGNPNAFAYGRTRTDARVVVTSGLIELLSPEEMQAVVAHELGHVEHRDFIVMTLAQTAPLILYLVYVWTDRIRVSYTWVVSLGAYGVYVLSQYLVLLLSRTREFFADEASALATGNPDNLSNALVKICYGLARNPAAAGGLVQPSPSSGAANKHPDLGRGRSWIATVSASAGLGIFSARDAAAFAMTNSDATGSFCSSAMADAMQWELKNPWARWFEINSTHPLAARRILALSDAAKRLGVQSRYGFETSYSNLTYSGNFVFEFLTYSLPVLGTLGGAFLGASIGGSGWIRIIGYGLIGFALGRVIKTASAYPAFYPIKDEPIRTVQDLVAQEINASPTAPVPCQIEGEIIGRGVPGLFYSPDLVVKDQT